MSSRKTSFTEYLFIILFIVLCHGFIHNHFGPEKTSNYNNGLKKPEKTVKIDAGTGGTYYDMGIIYGRSDLYEQAMKDFQEIKKLKAVFKTNPDDVDAHYNLGKVYTKRGLHDKAIKKYKEVLRIKPEHIEANAGFELASLHLSGTEKEKVVEKEKELKTADIKSTGKKGYKKYILILLLIFTAVILKKVLHKKTMEEYKKIIKANPNNAKAHLGLGSIYMNEDLNDQAREEFKEAIKINPDYGDAHCYLGIIYYQGGLYKEAIKGFKESLRIDPDYNIDAHYGLAESYTEEGLDEQAIEEFKKAIKINSGLAHIHYGLGQVYYKKNDSNR